jgi:hypothetical protein
MTNDPRITARIASRLHSIAFVSETRIDREKLGVCPGDVDSGMDALSDTHHVSPRAKMVLPVCQLWMLMTSLNQ